MRVLPLLALAAVGLGSLAACDSGSASGSASGSTTYAVRLKDAPFPFDLADSANVAVRRVELVSGDDSTESVVLYDGAPIRVNLLDLQGGIDTLLTTESVPGGTYRQIRFLLADDARVVFADGRTFPLRVPSGQQSGIKVNLPAHAATSETDTVHVLVDFDVSDSFVVRGNPESPNFQGFLFKPVLRVERLEVGGDSVAVRGD
jgi:hypothetical protein